MGLPNRIAKILDQWLGQGEIYEQISPRMTVSDGTNNASLLKSNGCYALAAIAPGHICAANSTNTPLAADATWTGTAEEILNHAVIEVSVIASHASATDGLVIEYSHDGTNWDFSDEYTIAAATGKLYSLPCHAKYFRVRYTNGSSEQTYFRLQTILKAVYTKPSSHRVADPISEQDDAELMKAVLTAYNGTEHINIQATPSNNLRVTDAESTLAVAKGEVDGASAVNKWGNAPDFDTADGEIDIWDGAEKDAAFEAFTYTFSDSNDIEYISSDSTSDTNTVRIEGLRSGVEVYEIVTLNGQTPVQFTAMNAVNRMYNNNGTLFVGHIMAYTDPGAAITNGVPNDTSKIRSIIHPDEQQTEQAVYTVPSGKTAYILGGYASTAGASKDSNYIVKFKAQEPSGVFRTKQKLAISDNGTSMVQFSYGVPSPFPAGTRLKVTAKMTAVGGTGASVSAGFSIILIED